MRFSKLRRFVLTVTVMSLAPLSASPIQGQGASVPGRCCFMVSVDVEGGYADQYEGTAPGTWHGQAAGSWAWHTRFIAGFTGTGLAISTLDSQALASAEAQSAASYDILFLKPNPPQHRSCHGGQGGDADTITLQSVKARSGLAAAAQNVNGYGRALVLTSPNRISFTCAPLGASSHAITGLLSSADTYAIKAPSVDNFLGGSNFARSCWQRVDEALPNPFKHHFTGHVTLGVQFQYFPLQQLDGKKAALGSRVGKADESAAIGAAKRGLADSPKLPADAARCN